MSSDPAILSDLSRALYRAALYVSFSDRYNFQFVRKNAQTREFRHLLKFMKSLQKKNQRQSFAHELGKGAEAELQTLIKRGALGESDAEALQKDLQSVPHDVENAVILAAKNLSKNDARLYLDILTSAIETAAQASDELDDISRTSTSVTIFFLDIPALINIRQIFNRLMRFFLQFNPNAAHLNELKVSTKESDAMGRVSAGARNGWLTAFPQDGEMNVQDYIRNEAGV